MESASALPPQAEPNHLQRAALIWVALSILGVVAVIFGLPLVLPRSGSDIEGFANLTIIVFTAMSVPVAFFVWVFLGYSLVVFRVKDRPADDGPALQPSPAAQIGWLAITGVLCLFLVVWGLLGVYEQTVASSTRTLTVNVTGQQWTWTYSYPQYGISTHVLDLPVNRPVQFKVTSLDVLHGFEITELGVRIDANPGEIVSTSLVTPSRVASYTARCMELCGLYHSYMLTPVNVVSGTAFTAWVKQQGGKV